MPSKVRAALFTLLGENEDEKISNANNFCIFEYVGQAPVIRGFLGFLQTISHRFKYCQLNALPLWKVLHHGGLKLSPFPKVRYLSIDWKLIIYLQMTESILESFSEEDLASA